MRFMVTIQIVVPAERRDAVASLMPAEREYVAEHLKQGVLEAIYYEEAMPPVYIWAVMRADSLEEAQRLVAGYPLHEFFQLAYTPLR
jgi:muconolactone delta-isomerase